MVKFNIIWIISAEIFTITTRIARGIIIFVIIFKTLAGGLSPVYGLKEGLTGLSLETRISARFSAGFSTFVAARVEPPLPDPFAVTDPEPI